jgi:hypothetical protein
MEYPGFEQVGFDDPIGWPKKWRGHVAGETLVIRRDVFVGHYLSKTTNPTKKAIAQPKKQVA